jgi:hypothetical protein
MPTTAMLWLQFMCALSHGLASSAAADPLPSLPPLGSFTSWSEAAHLKNSQLAHEILFGLSGLDAADVGVLIEGERAELMAALTDSGLQLGDRVKIRLWMDRQSARETRSSRTEAPIAEAASVWRGAQADPSRSEGVSQGHGGTPDPAAPGLHLHRVARRAQETEQVVEETHAADGKGGGQLSAEAIAIMVTVLLSLASYGPKGRGSQ